MSLLELFAIAAGLSMDAFAVSVCKGLSMPKMNWNHASVVGLYFGGFQAGMPLIGYLLGSQFKDSMASINHWVAFILLGIIGINMIKESFHIETQEYADNGLAPKNMIMMAVATSIDAPAVGVTFAFLQVNIITAIFFIGVITFTLSVMGVKVGTIFGVRYKSKAEMAGGIILILMGIKILAEHLLY